MRRAFIAAFVFLLLAQPFAAARAQAPLPEPLRAAIARIDAMAAAEHAKDELGSVTVGVIAGSRLVWAKSYGYADVESKTPATPETVYRIGSITKRFTGLMLLQLVQDGKVKLSDPVEKYLPEVTTIRNGATSGSRLTFEQLATMTSGLAREPANTSTYSKGSVSNWEAMLLAALPETRYDSAPGTRYLYSNIGYAMLGAALARAAGVPYVQYVQARILTPLDMKETVFEPNVALRARIATGYGVGSDGQVRPVSVSQQQEGRGYRVPNGALYSTIADLARFVAFELGEGPETVLQKRFLDETFERLDWTSARQSSAYGIGVQLRRLRSLVVFGHDGDVPGFLANMRFDRSSKSAVIVLRNVNGGRFDLRGFTYDALTEIAKVKL